MLHKPICYIHYITLNTLNVYIVDISVRLTVFVEIVEPILQNVQVICMEDLIGDILSWLNEV